MAGAKDVLLRFLVDDKQKSKLKGIGDEAGKTQSKFSQLSGTAKAVTGGLVALGATKIVSFLNDAAQAALQDLAAQKQLAVALQNTVGATDQQIGSVEKWIEKLSRASGVADDELRPALAELVRTTGDLETAQDTLGVAMDISTAKGIPLETITRAIGKAAGGNVGALGRLGVATKDADGKTLSFEEALAEAARTMGGATAAAADTAEGKMRRMQVAVDEAKESLGSALLPVMEAAAESINDTAVVTEFLGEKLGDLIPASEGTGGAIMSMIGPLGISRFIMRELAERINEMEEAAGDAIPTVIGSADSYDHMAGSVDEATVALQDFEDEVRSQIDPIFNLITKINDLDTAQSNSATARNTYGEGSPEHQAALRKEAEAWLAVKDAQIKAAAESGITRETFRTNLENMQIFTGAEIDLMLIDFDRVNDYQFDDKTPVIRWGGLDVIEFRDPTKGKGPKFHQGGVVPGPPGSDVPIIAQAGETVTPAHRTGGGGTEIIQLVVDGQVLAETIRRHDRSLLPR